MSIYHRLVSVKTGDFDMKKWFLKIDKAVDGTDMYVSEGFSLDEEQRCALCFDTKQEAEEYAMEMPDDDVVVVEEEII